MVFLFTHDQSKMCDKELTRHPVYKHSLWPCTVDRSCVREVWFLWGSVWPRFLSPDSPSLASRCRFCSSSVLCRLRSHHSYKSKGLKNENMYQVPDSFIELWTTQWTTLWITVCLPELTQQEGTKFWGRYCTPLGTFCSFDSSFWPADPSDIFHSFLGSG